MKRVRWEDNSKESIAHMQACGGSVCVQSHDISVLARCMKMICVCLGRLQSTCPWNEVRSILYGPFMFKSHCVVPKSCFCCRKVHSWIIAKHLVTWMAYGSKSPLVLLGGHVWSPCFELSHNWPSLHSNASLHFTMHPNHLPPEFPISDGPYLLVWRLSRRQKTHAVLPAGGRVSW